MTSINNLDRRVSELEDGTGGPDDDAEDLRFEIIRKTVEGELVEKEICHYDESEEWTSEEITGFNYSVSYEGNDE